MALEKAVVTRIVKALRNVPGLVVRKRHGTVLGVAGDPDLYGSFQGQHFEFEVKRPNDSASRLTKLQTERLAEWKRGGAIVGVVRSVVEAMSLLELQPEETLWICIGCRNYRWASADAPARCPRCGHTRFEEDA
jgi:DNA-directed RNA polymerase subunit RPC12/RpoP